MLRPWRPGITIAYRADGTAVSAICQRAASFVRYADELMREAPVKDLTLPEAGKYMSELIELPAFRQMTELTLQDLGDDGATILGRSPLDVERLVVVECHLTTAGVRGLVPVLPRLAALDMSRNAIGDAGASIVAGAVSERLEDLALAGCTLTDAGVRALASASRLRPKRLRLDGDPIANSPWQNRLHAPAATALARSSWVAGVEHLQLAATSLGDDGAVALAAIAAPGPTDLDVRHDLLGLHSSVTALSNAAWSRLRRIGLSSNMLNGTRLEKSYDYDGSVVAEGPAPLNNTEIAQQFGFAAHGVEVY